MRVLIRRITILVSLILTVSCGNNLLKAIEEKSLQLDNPSLPPSSWVKGELEPSASAPVPASVVASEGSYADKIRIEWSPVRYMGEDANYHVYRSLDGIAFEKITEAAIPLKYNFYEDLKGDAQSSVGENQDYFYAVKAVFQNQTIYSHYSFLAKGFVLSRPIGLSAGFRDSEQFIALNWGKGKGALYYQIQVSGPYGDKEDLNDISSSKTQLIEQQFSTLSLFDYSTDFQGIRIPGKKYFYRIRSCYNSSTQSAWSQWVAGSILAPGAPAKPIQVSASKGTYSDSIEVVWKKDPAAVNYSIFMESDASGEFTTVTAESLTNVCQIPLSSLERGKHYYFRISAQNGDGDSGPLSDLDVKQAEGFLLNPVSPYIVYGFTHSAQVLAAWDPIEGANRGYAIWRSAPFDSYDGTTPLVDLAPAYDQWTALHSDESNLISENYYSDGDVVEGKWYLYKLTAFNSAYQSDNPFYDTSGALEPDEIGENPFSDLKQKGKSPSVFVMVSTSKSAPFLLNSITPSQNDVDCLNAVKVLLQANQVLPAAFLTQFGTFIELKLEKHSKHGEDPDLNPNSEPSAQGEALFRLAGKPIRENIEIFDLSLAELSQTTQISWSDPMNDFAADGSISGTLKWDYRRWNREAWKDIIRKKPFDMQRAVAANYKAVVRWKNGDSNWPESHTEEVSGYPALAAEEFALLGAFMRECAFNRLYILSWVAQIDANINNLSHVKDNPMNFAGEYGGNVQFEVTSIDLLSLTGYGRGVMDHYSDWGEDWAISINTPDHSFSMDLQRGTEVFVNFPLEISTPLYDGTLEFEVKVFMGLYQRGVRGGSVQVKQKGRSTEYAGYEILNSYRANPSMGRYDPPESQNIVFGNYTTINFNYHYDLWVAKNYDITDGMRYYGFY